MLGEGPVSLVARGKRVLIGGSDMIRYMLQKRPWMCKVGWRETRGRVGSPAAHAAGGHGPNPSSGYENKGDWVTNRLERVAARLATCGTRAVGGSGLLALARWAVGGHPGEVSSSCSDSPGSRQTSGDGALKAKKWETSGSEGQAGRKAA